MALTRNQYHSLLADLDRSIAEREEQLTRLRMQKEVSTFFVQLNDCTSKEMRVPRSTFLSTVTNSNTFFNCADDGETTVTIEKSADGKLVSKFENGCHGYFTDAELETLCKDVQWKDSCCEIKVACSKVKPVWCFDQETICTTAPVLEAAPSVTVPEASGMKKAMEDIFVLYHGGCLDGFVSALTVWSKFGYRNVRYIPCAQGKPPPDVTGKIIYILDMAYRKDILLDMIKRARNLLVIDHHKSHQESLSEIPEQYKIFDMNECGATLTWYYFFPDRPLPLMYKYIRSRDLWTNEMEHTSAFQAAFGLACRNKEGNYSFKRASKYLNDYHVHELVNRGICLEEYQESIITKALSTTFFCPVRLPHKKELVICAYINTTVLSSDIGSRCMEKFPFVDFCVCFSIDAFRQMTHFSLRSTDDREDVSIIASHHGDGGGHRNSAGCKLEGLKCRLNYEHLDPEPIWCLYKGKSFRTEGLSEEYLQLIHSKFQ